MAAGDGFLALAEALADGMDAALRAAADAAAEEARRLAPVDSGELAESIRTRKHGAGYRVEVTAAHAGFVEFGTEDTRPQPFVRPAFESQGRMPLRMHFNQALRRRR